MTIILLIVSGFFTGLGFLFRYLNQYADWLNWVGVGAWIIACLFAIWAIVSLFQWLIERRRRKAQLWHKRYVDLTAAQHTQKIILEFHCPCSSFQYCRLFMQQRRKHKTRRFLRKRKRRTDIRRTCDGSPFRPDCRRDPQRFV